MSYSADWHELVEEGWVVADFRTHDGGEWWRKEMRDRARRAKRKIRTGRADQMELRVWAILTDTRRPSITASEERERLQEAFDHAE